MSGPAKTASAAGEDWPARVRRLEEEVAGLRRAMRTRGLIEQAKGMLAERLGCDPESAFGILSTRSQQTNVPLVTLAADLVGAPVEATEPTTDARKVGPTPLGLAAGSGAPELETITDLGRQPKTPALPAAAARNLRLAIAALDAAADVEELTRAIVTVGLAGRPDGAAALFVTEPDGALRMLACHGWPAQAISEWRRLPSSINTTVGHAVRTGAPMFVDGAAQRDFVLIGPASGARVAFPLAVGGRIVGAFHLALPVDTFGQHDRLHLSHLAVAAGRALRRLWPTAAAGQTVTELDWVRAVLDALHDEAHLLTPVRDSEGNVVDFVVEAVSGQTAEPDRGAVGRRLLDAYPHLADNGVFASYVDVLARGHVWHEQDSSEEIIVNGRKRRILVSRRASRVGGAVLASWRRLDEMISKDRHLDTLEAFGGFGWAEWDLNTGDARWSAGMYRLLGKEPLREPTPFESLADHFDPADRHRVDSFTAEVLSGHDAVADIRRKAGDEVRWLRLFCETQPDAISHKTVQMLAHDVSEGYEREHHLRSLQSRAAAGRLRLASQQDLMARLVHLLYPKETVSVTTDGAVVTGRHVLHDVEQPLRADFCDAVQLADGKILVFVGDMFGAGIAAAATAVRLVRPVIALGFAGTPMTRILDVLNADLQRDEEPSLASLLLGEFDPRTGDFSYASAGHLPPVLLRRGRRAPKLLTGAAGPALGLIEAPEYSQETVGLASGDVIVFYTDGLIDQRDEDPLGALTKVLVEHYRNGGVQALQQLSVPQSADETCMAVLEVRRLKSP